MPIYCIAGTSIGALVGAGYASGQRGEGFYAGYFRNLDGNKLNAFVFA